MKPTPTTRIVPRHQQAHQGPPPPRAGHGADFRATQSPDAPQANVGPQERARRFFTSNPTRGDMLQYLAQAAGSDTLVVV